MKQTEFPFVSFAIGDKAFKEKMDLIEYPFYMKKKKFYFYPYEGDGCVPVEKFHGGNTGSNLWIRIYTINNDLKISKLGQEISSLIKNLKDGVYIVDTNRMKVVYDLTLMDSVDSFFSMLVPSKIYNQYLVVTHNLDIDKNGKKEIALLKGGKDLSLLGIASLATFSTMMIKPKTLREFGSSIYKKILEETDEIPVIDSRCNYINLEDFLMPQNSGFVLNDENKKGISILDAEFGKWLENNDHPQDNEIKNNDVKTDPFKMKLSNIINSGKLTFTTTPEDKTLNVEIDIQPDGEKIIDAYVYIDHLYLEVDKDLSKPENLKALKSKFDLDFIIWLGNNNKYCDILPSQE